MDARVLRQSASAVGFAGARLPFLSVVNSGLGNWGLLSFSFSISCRLTMSAFR